MALYWFTNCGLGILSFYDGVLDWFFYDRLLHRLLDLIRLNFIILIVLNVLIVWARPRARTPTLPIAHSTHINRRNIITRL